MNPIDRPPRTRNSCGGRQRVDYINTIISSTKMCCEEDEIGSFGKRSLKRDHFNWDSQAWLLGGGESRHK